MLEKLGNDESCQVIGIDNIVLKLEHGQFMLYVSVYRKNFISIGILDDENHQIEIKNGFTNISRNQKSIV